MRWWRMALASSRSVALALPAIFGTWSGGICSIFPTSSLEKTLQDVKFKYHAILLWHAAEGLEDLSKFLFSRQALVRVVRIGRCHKLATEILAVVQVLW